MSDIIEIVKEYIDRGWSPLPIEHKRKECLLAEWQHLRIGLADVPRYFNGGPQNVGIIFGPASKDLVDVDLDCPEAIIAAPYLLPPTNAIFGRRSKPVSHWLYIAKSPDEEPRAGWRYRDPVKGNDGKQDTLIELRTGWGKGAQTIFPGSMHRSDERLTWDAKGEPATVDGKDLHTAVKLVSVAALLARHAPGEGGRHDYHLRLGGFFARAGLTRELTRRLVNAVFAAAGDSEREDRVRAADDQWNYHQAGRHSFGWPELADAIGKDLVMRKIAEILNYNCTAGPFDDWRMDDATALDPKTLPAGITVDDFYAHIPDHSYLFIPTRTLWPGSSINALIPPVPTKGGRTLKASLWLDRNRAIQQTTWAPGLPMLIEDKLIADGGWFDRKGLRVFNTYRPVPKFTGDADAARPWLDHLRKIYPDEAEHILGWLAWRKQRPDIKINHALVLGGVPGIGKDTLLAPFKRAVGHWNFAEASPKQIMERPFNSYLKSIVLRISEARDLGEFNRFAFYDRTKTYIAEPPETLPVEDKHVPAHYIANVTGVIITTNHKTNGLYLPEDDRRHFVAWSNAKPADFGEHYWNELWGWFDRGGYGHVVAWLNAHDLSRFDPKRPPPKTPAFWVLVDTGRGPDSDEMAAALDALGNPDAITLELLISPGGLDREFRDRKRRAQLPYLFESVGFERFANPGTKDHLWVIGGRRMAIYVRAELSTPERYHAVQKLQERCEGSAT